MEPSTPAGKIGRYFVQGELGRGAMGVVYRAQDPAIGRVVAIKTIRIGQFSDERELKHVRERMVREAQAAGMLSHNNIVTIYDIQEEADTAFIFMEYVDGETLEKILLADTPVDQQLILWVAKQSSEALDYAHARGIVHRDIKPANIMVRKDGVAKIADFGIARVQSQSMTQTGQVLGTPNYMSPEQISGKAVDGRADQYSLAVMLYEVLTGEKPFVADSLPTLLFKVVSEIPAPVPRLNPTLSPAIDEVLQRALAKSPDDRFPSCTEFIRALERACNATPGWKTLVRGGGLTQPTHFSSPTPAPVPVVNKPVPVPQAPARTESSKPMNLALIGGVAAAMLVVGIGAVGAKLYFDKRKQQTVAAPPVVDPAPVKAATPAPTGGKPMPTAGQLAPTAAPKTVPPPLEPKQPSAPPVASPPKSGGVMAAVSIRTNPEGARVIVDDGQVPPCTSPCLLELPGGRHAAAILLDDYRTEMRIFNVPQDTVLSVNLEKKKGMLEVSSNPAGASITIDGAENPHKTPALIPLAVGKHTVVVSLPGKPAYTRSFEMRADATISLNADLGN